MCVMLVMEGGCGGAGNAADTPSTTISGVAVAFAAVIGTATPADDVEGAASMDASAAFPDIIIIIDYGALEALGDICKMCH